MSFMLFFCRFWLIIDIVFTIINLNERLFLFASYGVGLKTMCVFNRFINYQIITLLILYILFSLHKNFKETIFEKLVLLVVLFLLGYSNLHHFYSRCNEYIDVPIYP